MGIFISQLYFCEKNMRKVAFWKKLNPYHAFLLTRKILASLFSFEFKSLSRNWRNQKSDIQYKCYSIYMYQLSIMVWIIIFAFISSLAYKLLSHVECDFSYRPGKLCLGYFFRTTHKLLLFIVRGLDLLFLSMWLFELLTQITTYLWFGNRNIVYSLTNYN